jgi:hypothetical protein
VHTLVLSLQHPKLQPLFALTCKKRILIACRACGGLLGKLFVFPSWLFPDFCPVFLPNIFINFDWAAAMPVSIPPVFLRTRNPVTFSGLYIVVVRTRVRATLLKSLSSIQESLARSIEPDTTNAGRTTIVMAASASF